MKRYNLLWLIMGIIPLINACKKDHREIEREWNNSQGLDLNFSFVNKPEPGTELIARLYYAEKENEAFYENNPAKVLKYNLSAKSIEQGVTLTFEEPIPTPFAYVIAFADVDGNGEISDDDIAICYLAQSVREVMSGVAKAEDVSKRQFLTMTMDQVYSSKRPPLEVNLTFPSPPLAGAILELALYYAETEDTPLTDREPDVIHQHTLTEGEIKEGLTLTFEDLEDVPYLFARAYVDIDEDDELSYGDIAMFYGEKTINEVLKNKVTPENIGPRSNISIPMSLWHADEDGPLVDIDGHEYNTVIIGGLEWMAENLKVTHYRNGAPIPTGLSTGEWISATGGAYAVYPYTQTNGAIASEEEMIAQYGLLYNGHAVMDVQGLAPAGWRVATDEDFKALERFLGMSEEDIEKTGSRGAMGAKLRIASWSGGTDEFGFAAVSGGYRQGEGEGAFRVFGSWDGNNLWTGTYGGSTSYMYRRSIRLSPIERLLVGVKSGLNVRCVRDK